MSTTNSGPVPEPPKPAALSALYEAEAAVIALHAAVHKPELWTSDGARQEAIREQLATIGASVRTAIGLLEATSLASGPLPPPPPPPDR